MIEERASIALGSRTIDYVLRRNPRSRGLRMTIDDRRGLVVSIPPISRRGWAAPRARVETFIREREPWVLRHLERAERRRVQSGSLTGSTNGGSILFRGEPHRISVRPAAVGARRSTVERVGGPDRDELVIRMVPRERRAVTAIVEAWLRVRARAAIDEAVARHAAALGVAPAALAVRDPGSRWGSASKKGRVMLSWRLVLAPPDVLETVVVHELAHLRVFGHGPRFWSLVASRRPGHLRDRAWLRRNAHLLHAALQGGSEEIAQGA